jgi:hypothetical protein
MKPHPRIRKTIKWGGAAAILLLLVVWLGSGWGRLLWQTQGWWRFVVARGRIVVTHSDPAVNKSSPQVDFGAGEFRWEWRYFRTSAGGGWAVALPLWWPLPFLAVGTAAAWRLDTVARRRVRLNLCPKCNYDRAGIAADAKCPECGAMPGGNGLPAVGP